MKRFYEEILTDINKFSHDDTERAQLIERLNTYMSLKAGSVAEIAAVIRQVLAAQAQKSK
jgi:hypothetical protein